MQVREAILVDEEREDPNACEMRRIKGLQTSRRGGEGLWGMKNG